MSEEVPPAPPKNGILATLLDAEKWAADRIIELKRTAREAQAQASRGVREVQAFASETRKQIKRLREE